jgi:hypothetical protein
MKLHAADAIILSLITAAVSVFSVSVYRAAFDEGELTISVEGGSGKWVFPEDAQETVTVKGPLGDTIVRVHKGAARVLDSPCANKLCIAQGEIHDSGSWVSCIPNRVIVTIQRKKAQNQVDGGVW